MGTGIPRQKAAARAAGASRLDAHNVPCSPVATEPIATTESSPPPDRGGCPQNGPHPGPSACGRGVRSCTLMVCSEQSREVRVEPKRADAADLHCSARLP